MKARLSSVISKELELNETEGLLLAASWSIIMGKDKMSKARDKSGARSL